MDFTHIDSESDITGGSIEVDSEEEHKRMSAQNPSSKVIEVNESHSEDKMMKSAPSTREEGAFLAASLAVAASSAGPFDLNKENMLVAEDKMDDTEDDDQVSSF